MLSDFHQVTFTVGSQRRCSFCWFLQKPHGGAWATRKQLPASKPPCCEEAPTRPCRGVPWPSSETKPRAAWPATSCCVHTHSPACLPAPAHVWRELHGRPEPETLSRALLIETMRGDKMSAADMKPLNLGEIYFLAIDHKPYHSFSLPLSDSP